MANPHATSAHEATARAIKAEALADVLEYHGATADQAEALPAAGRRMAEALADVNESSDATWVLVVANLRGRHPEPVACVGAGWAFPKAGGGYVYPHWDEEHYRHQLTIQLHQRATEMVDAFHSFDWVDDDNSREGLAAAARRLQATLYGFTADGLMAARTKARRAAEVAS